MSAALQGQRPHRGHGPSFAIGETTKTVAVHGDTTDTFHEKFRVALTAPFKAGISDPSGTGTITNDD